MQHQTNELPTQQGTQHELHHNQCDTPRILIVDDQHMSQKLANLLFLRVKHAQLTSVTDIDRACEAMSFIGCDFVIVNEASQLDQINGFLEDHPFDIRLKGVIWITNKEEVSFNPEILRKVRVFLMDSQCEGITDKIELVAHGWDGTSH